MTATSTWVDPRDDPQPPYQGPQRYLANDEAAFSELVAACKEGRLYDVERWIAAGNPLQFDPSVEGRIRRRPIPLQVSGCYSS